VKLMKYRMLGRTGWSVSEVSFGAWAIGASWGPVDDRESLATLHRAVDCGVNFIDTADVYGDGRSERLVGQLLRERSETLYVATKAGRRLSPHAAAGYCYDNLAAFVERSLRNLGVEALHVLQLHCPPPECYDRQETYDALDRLQREGKILHYGMSVKTPEEALKAVERPGVQSIQIIFNLFRHRPAERFFAEARRRQVGVLARVPLASGLLTGRITGSTAFPADDHRNYNRAGAAFDVGETFSGVDLAAGLEAVEELRALLPPGVTLAQFALRWILMHEAVTCAIPGGKRPSQIEENAAASDLPPLTAAQMDAVRELYDRRIRALVHHRW
jgi:aryl-alcohol dehydrogenase-like predicted oxidoreductase